VKKLAGILGAIIALCPTTQTYAPANSLLLQHPRRRPADFTYVCNVCRLNCKAVVSDKRMRQLIDQVPQAFCPFDDKKPKFKPDEARDLAT
jgi:hypothetical protein